MADGRQWVGWGGCGSVLSMSCNLKFKLLPPCGSASRSERCKRREPCVGSFPQRIGCSHSPSFPLFALLCIRDTIWFHCFSSRTLAPLTGAISYVSCFLKVTRVGRNEWRRQYGNSDDSELDSRHLMLGYCRTLALLRATMCLSFNPSSRDHLSCSHRDHLSTSL